MPSQRRVQFSLAQQMQKELVERKIHDLLAIKPVVMEAKAFNAIGLGDVDLLAHDIGHTQVVVTQVGWQVGLVVPFVLRQGLGGVRPLGEALAPSFVVDGKGVELRQVISDESGA